jgi:hypothetical protein
MRKQYKNKLKSCSMCKPHKTGHANRWTVKEQLLMKLADKEIKEALAH